MSTTQLVKKPAKTRPGLKMGQANEYFLMTPITPDGAARLRKILASGWTGDRQKNTDRIGTVHDLRMVLFDNDTRVIFASTYDGDWDAYMDDFATIIPDELDYVFSDFAGYPGARTPGFKDWLSKNQVEAVGFYSAYPDASVKDVWKALKAKKALDDLLDTASS
jgi:hypothetical protein